MLSRHVKARTGLFLVLILLCAGCATIFGWNIHAPGILSKDFYSRVSREEKRVALFIPDGSLNLEVKNRGGRFADPQTYYLGEAWVPMLIEGFQHGFTEFILMETEPTPDIMKAHGIPNLAVLTIEDFRNRVGLKGQAVELLTELQIFNKNLEPVARVEIRGSSDAEKVFAKRGGPEVNLNAAIENNISAAVQYIQDFLNQEASPV